MGFHQADHGHINEVELDKADEILLSNSCDRMRGNGFSSMTAEGFLGNPKLGMLHEVVIHSIIVRNRACQQGSMWGFQNPLNVDLGRFERCFFDYPE